MPGIVAIIGKNIDEKLLSRMTRSIVHEKWQLTDLFWQPPLAIGRVHLGIVNPEPQPIFNESKSICVFMDGEIYGSEEERKQLEKHGHKFEIGNDPELCLHMFEEYGEGFIAKLNGSFLLIIHDKKHRKVLIANDRHGLRPIYYTTDGNRFLLSSEIKAFLQDKTFKKDIDDKAIADFFAFNRIFGNKTFFKKVKLVLPGSIIIWSDGKILQKRYWSITFSKNKLHLSQEYCANKLALLFMKAVERRTKGEHRLGVFLSGGLDSRSVAGALRKFGVFNTFTYGYLGGDEMEIAAKVAEELNTKHVAIEFRDDFLPSYAEKAVYITDGMLNCSNILLNCAFQTARENADIVFTGGGMEYLLFTYLARIAFHHAASHLSSVFLEREIAKSAKDMFAYLLYKEVNVLITDELAPFFYSPEYFQKIKGYTHKSFQQALEGAKGPNPVDRTDCFLLQMYSRYYLSVGLLRNYVEHRSVAMDNDFFDFFLQIPTEVRYGIGLYSKFISRISPKLAEIPYQRTGFPPKWPPLAHTIGYLVKGGYKLVMQRLKEITRGLINIPQKIGYPDLDECIRRDPKTREFFKSILLDERTLARPYFNREFILKMLSEHMNASKNWGIPLCALLTFELWNRYFIDA